MTDVPSVQTLLELLIC